MNGTRLVTSPGDFGRIPSRTDQIRPKSTPARQGACYDPAG
jgi:hypothetical protein